MTLYYLDTSIWLDFLEDRDEPGFPKTFLAQEIVKYIVKTGHAIIISDLVLEELSNAGYHEREVDLLLDSLREVLIFVETTPQQMRRAKDLAAKRAVPLGDAIHALIARDRLSILVTYDRHFQRLLDIVIPQTPRDIK